MFTLYDRGEVRLARAPERCLFVEPQDLTPERRDEALGLLNHWLDVRAASLAELAEWLDQQTLTRTSA